MKKNFKTILMLSVALPYFQADTLAMKIEEIENISPIKQKGNFLIKEAFSDSKKQTQPAPRDDDFFAIYLDRIDINRLSNPDWLSKDEGSVVLTFNNPNIQGKPTQTTLYWSGWTTKGKKVPSGCVCICSERTLTFEYGDHLLAFFSPQKNLDRIDFSAAVTSNDDEDAKKWKKASEVIGSAAKASGPIPEYGPAISAGLGVISGVADLVSQLYHNSTELFYVGDFFRPDKQLKITDHTGFYTVGYTRGLTADPDITLRFRAERLSAVANPAADQSLQLASSSQTRGIKIILENLQLGRTEKENKYIKGKIIKDSMFSIRKYFQAKKLAVFELKVGEVATKNEIYPNAFKEDRVSFKDVEVYRGEWNPAGIPASVSLVCSESAADFSKLISATSDLAKVVIPADPTGQTFGPKAIAIPLIDGMQTVSSSLLASLAPESSYTLFSLGTNLIRKSQETIEFPIYSNKNQKKLGYITAKFKVEACAIEKKVQPSAQGSGPSSSSTFLKHNIKNNNNNLIDLDLIYKINDIIEVFYQDGKKYRGLYDQYYLSPVLGDGDCFYHAAFTEDGQDAGAMKKFAKEDRAKLPQLVMSQKQFKAIMRREILADYKTNIEKYQMLNELDALSEMLKKNQDLEVQRDRATLILGDRLSRKKYGKNLKELSNEDQKTIQEVVMEQLPESLKGSVLYPDAELLKAIPEKIIATYVDRYKTNNGPDSYIEVPDSKEHRCSIGDVIAESHDKLIHCFLYDPKKGRLDYHTSIGNKHSKNVGSILHDGLNHYWALYNPAELDSRLKEVAQARKNAGDITPLNPSKLSDPLILEERKEKPAEKDGVAQKDKQKNPSKTADRKKDKEKAENKSKEVEKTEG